MAETAIPGIDPASTRAQSDAKYFIALKTAPSRSDSVLTGQALEQAARVSKRNERRKLLRDQTVRFPRRECNGALPNLVRHRGNRSKMSTDAASEDDARRKKLGENCKKNFRARNRINTALRGGAASATDLTLLLTPSRRAAFRGGPWSG